METKINILLIEDNPADSELVSIFLKGVYSSKASLVTADTLIAGMQLIEEESFDIIILDLSLPDSWGIETLTKLHTKVPHIPIIVLTGLEDETVGINAVKMGAQDFLIKGKLKGADLHRSINYSIERHKLLQLLAEKTDALSLEKEKLDEAQKLAHIGSWERDLRTQKITWSHELYRIYGLEPDKDTITHDLLASFLHPDDEKSVRSTIETITKSSKQLTVTHRIIRKDGTTRTLYSSGKAIKNDKGEALKLIGTSQDITEKLEEEEMEKLAMAATKSFNSVVITNTAGNIEWVNEGFESLTGYTLNEVKGVALESLKAGSETEVSENDIYYKRVLAEKIPVTYESKKFTKQGKEYWSITTLTPVLGKKNEVKLIISIDSDITLRKQMEKDLVNANQKAEQSLVKASKALNELTQAKGLLEESMNIKGQFLANMSHEIRTPMNAIIGFTHLTLKTPLSQEQKQYINAIKTSGENLLVIINDILDFSKIQSGKIPLEQIAFNLSEVVNSSVELMLPESQGKDLKLSLSIDPKVPDKLVGDPTRLNQILLNIIGNAIKFTKKGEIKVGVELVSEKDDSAAIKFVITDTGIGIPKSKLDHIFDAFTQATYDTARKYGGTGLGLAIVKQLVDLLHGEITVESEVNKGSVFTFNIVYKKNLATKTNVTPIAKNNELDSIKDLNILLVEDNMLNQVLAQKVLSEWGWNVEVASNGLVAIDKIEKSDFDLILMDIQLPEMDGYEATQHIRNKLPAPKSETPIIAMTAHAISGEEKKCHKLGMNGYVSKPFMPDVLHKEIASVLKMSQETEENPDGENDDDNFETNTMGTSVNLSYLRKIADGNNEFIRQILTLFIEQVPAAIKDLEKYKQEQNWAMLGKVAHKMKPSLLFVGLTNLEKDIKELENCAQPENNRDDLEESISHIKNVCTETISALADEMELLK